MREPSGEVDALAREVIGAAIEVHRALGPGFLESVYETALCVELTARSIPFIRQAICRIEYKGQEVGEGRMDLVVANLLIVECKAVEALLPIHQAQVISYLRATGHELGLLINFNTQVLKDGIRRVVATS